MTASMRLGGLLLIALALPSCSLTGGEPYPEAQQAFLPFLACDTTCTVTEGVITADAVLLSKDDLMEGPSGSLVSVTLMAGDALFELYGVGRLSSDVPLDVGRRYLFEGATRDFSSAPNLGSVSLRVSDADGLAFYGARVTGLPGTAPSGTEADEALLLPAGWEVRAEPAGVGSRDALCSEETPYRIIFEYGDQSIRLVQSQRGRLGAYEVEVRVASRYIYDGSCLDGYRPEFSFVIVRKST